MHPHTQFFENESVLCSLFETRPLRQQNLSHVFNSLFDGHTPLSYARALFVLLAAKGETSDELFMAWKAIRRAEKQSALQVPRALDTCGTGGDGSHSINLSTLSSVVMAAAGVRVIKHGNRAITSRCGSSDLLAAFGMNLKQTPNQVIRSAQKVGMGYFHAPHVHPVYSRFQNLRQSLRIRTLFNLLGPVLNPVAVDYQILGVASPGAFKLYGDLLPKLNRKSALIFYGANGMDEITSLGLSQGVRINGKRSAKWLLNPAELGFKKGRPADLKIHSVGDAKQKAIQILKQRSPGTAHDSVILSAACGIWLADQATSIASGVRLAEKAVQSGKAWYVLQQLIRFSKL